MKTIYHRPINDPATRTPFEKFISLFRQEALYRVTLYDVYCDSYRFTLYASSRAVAIEKAMAFAAKEGIKNFEMAIKMIG